MLNNVFNCHEIALSYSILWKLSYVVRIEYQSVTSSIFFFYFFLHFSIFMIFFLHISVEHDEKPPHTKFDMNRFMVAQDMAAWIPN